MMRLAAVRQVLRCGAQAAPSALTSLRARCMSTADSPASSASPVAPATPAAAASVSERSRPPRRVQRAWADESSMRLLKEKGLKRPKWKKGEDGSDIVKRAIPALQRGAPKPRPKLPVPTALASIDKPWMQSQLALEFAAPATSADAASCQPFRLQITQWTGMEPIGWQPPRRTQPRSQKATNAADKVADEDAEEDGEEDDTSVQEWVEPPELTPEQAAAEDELHAQADAGSGTIVWDAALHLAHYLHAWPELVSGPVLELGSGTGALGLAVDAMLAQSRDSSDTEKRVVLSDGGKVLELLQHNVEANKSAAVVAPLSWSDVPSFLSRPDLPFFYSTLLCSELLDSIPSAANAHKAFDAASFHALVEALTQLAQHSAQAKRSAGATGGVTVWFTFEQRGVLSLGPDGVLEDRLFEPLRQAGFSVEQVFNDTPYSRGSALCLFKLHMQ